MKIDLNEGWNFRKSGKKSKNEWLKAVVPGTIHTDLLSHGLIPEPFADDNEKQLLWISESDWDYKTQFVISEKEIINGEFDLVFEGVDTVSKIFLNGKEIGETFNMFRTWKFDVSGKLKFGVNEIKVCFTSAYTYAKNEESKYGKLPVALNAERAYIRKAQYAFGWDWGPVFATCGIWRPVYLLEKKNPKIENVTFDTLKISEKKALVEIGFSVSKKLIQNHHIEVSLFNSRKIFQKNLTDRKSKQMKIRVDVDEPELWFPNGSGKQNLYALQIRIVDSEGKIIDSKEKRVGIRTIELQLKEGKKNVFRFAVNGKKIFSQGVNWIPADSFLPRVSKTKYRHLLEAVKNANMNVVRVWGGGIYESDFFYELCDELGLLVWQDFMFACGAYPEHKKFIENVKEEFRQNILRLQHHASLAVWCGNNECEWNWTKEQFKPIYTMPGFSIFRTLLPEMISLLDPKRPYWQSTPFGDDEEPNSYQKGNRHEWGLWSGFSDINSVKNDRSLFVTEFGFQGTANKKTFEKFISKSNRIINSSIFEWHNKAFDGPEKMARYMAAQLPVKTDWNSYLYLGQLTQSLCLKTCLEHWRGNQPETNGAIIWQINDCWPVTSWSLIDSELTPKMAYYQVKNCFSPHAVFLELNSGNLSAKIFSSETSEKIKLEIVAYHWKKNQLTMCCEKEIKHDSTQIFQSVSIDLKKIKNTDEIIFISSLKNSSGLLLHRNVLNTIPWKYIDLPKSKINLKVSKKNNRHALVAVASAPSFFVQLEGEDLVFSENGFTIFPDEEIECLDNVASVRLDKNNDISVICLNEILNEK